MSGKECIREILLSTYLDGELSGKDLIRVEKHLSACRDCRAAYEQMKADRDLLLESVGADAGVSDARYGDGCYAHDDFLWAARKRAMMLNASTAMVMMRAPVQASRCQSR